MTLESKAIGETMQDKLQDLLKLKCHPISITFTNNPPTDIARIDERAPSGCTYWKLAADGKVFYTEASDHFGCPIGAFTHNVELPPEQSKELTGMIETMVGLSYLKMEEIAAIPRREDCFRFAVYAPLDGTPVEPDVVLIRGNAKQIMLVAEAANAAVASNANGVIGRPTCAMIPAVMKSGQTAMSLGCIGNRVYRELPDDELYLAIPGTQVVGLVEKIVSIVNANHELQSFHQKRINLNPEEPAQ